MSDFQHLLDVRLDLDHELDEVTCFTFDEVAKMLNVARNTVRREVSRGHLEVSRIAGMPRIVLRELKRYMREDWRHHG